MHVNSNLTKQFDHKTYLSGIPTKATEDLIVAHACSAPNKVTYPCDRYTATMICGENERIHIRDAVYGFRYEHFSVCDDTDNTCEQGTDCCGMYDGDYSMDYGVSEKYSVYKTCSWKQKCTQQTQTGRMGKQESIYSVLKYECVKGMLRLIIMYSFLKKILLLGMINDISIILPCNDIVHNTLERKSNYVERY